MRIQHNIAALNSYRNLTGNNNAVSKNLEKLSSGYKINRAGDDAAGLAISEKMRAQITGLETAQKNANDGISLVQTAEGALTEVHSMLNRMVELADQSANGTYDNNTDRANLQKELNSLKSEIDRISEGTNFNGINLLDGSLSASGVNGSTASGGPVNLVTDFNGAELTIKDVAATKGSYKGTAFGAGDIKNGETMEFTISLNNGENVTVALTAKDYTDGTAGGELIGADGTVYGKYAAGAAVGPTAAELGKAMTAALKESAIGNDFKVVDGADGTFTLTNKVAGADAPQVMKDFNVTIKNADGTVKSEATNALAAASVKGADAYQTIDGSVFDNLAYDGSDQTVLSINDKKFAIIVDQATSAATADLIKKASDAGLEVIRVGSVDATNGQFATDGDGTLALGVTDGTDANANAAAKLQGDSIAAALGKALGMNITFVEGAGDATATPPTDVASHFEFKADTSINPNKKAGAGLTLQIGDTAEDFNQLTVSIGNMNSASLGIGGVDVSTQKGAKAAVELIKNAINSVSSTRGDLGAIQNRLEHTINNLSVTTENMTAAESRIRDVDMASEMMSYTKNNILVQASQAMLAQANQIPQGVLQLLQ